MSFEITFMTQFINEIDIRTSRNRAILVPKYGAHTFGGFVEAAGCENRKKNKSPDHHQCRRLARQAFGRRRHLRPRGSPGSACRTIRRSSSWSSRPRCSAHSRTASSPPALTSRASNLARWVTASCQEQIGRGARVAQRQFLPSRVAHPRAALAPPPPAPRLYSGSRPPHLMSA